MSTVVMHAVASVDGYIADENDEVGPLFDWYFNGDLPSSTNPWSSSMPRSVSPRPRCPTSGRSGRASGRRSRAGTCST